MEQSYADVLHVLTTYNQGYAYVLHVLAAFTLLSVFFLLYSKITPFDELALIRGGNTAAAFSLSGALIGFCLTLASSILHSSTPTMFLVWAVGAMIVQAVSYAAISRLIPQMAKAIEGNNTAMGGLMGAISITVGIINAACLS